MKTMCGMLAVMAAVCFTAYGQDTTRAAPTPGHDSAGTVVLQPRVAKYDYDAMPKDPIASLLFSAVIPGSGQLYNKEYLRALSIAVVFYGSVIGIQYYADKWTRLNTDTFYIQELDAVGNPTGDIRPVYTMKADKDQFGLKPLDKGLLVTCIALCAVSWGYGMFDAYLGAKRYNRKLLASLSLDEHPLQLSMSPDLSQASMAIRLKW